MIFKAMGKQRISALEAILGLLIVVGIVFAFINFFHFKSLWLDEAKLALNIVNKNTFGLLKPLDMNQVAPIGFLLTEKLLCKLFGNTDRVLRLLPFSAFLASTILFYFLSLRASHKRSFALLSTLFFVSSLNLIYYSAEAKQYMIDVLFSILISLYTFIFLESNDKRSVITYALIGMVAVWFSNISVVMLATMGLFSIIKAYKGNRKMSHVLIPLALWGISFITYYSLFIYNHPSKEALVSYWENVHGFLPTHILSSSFYSELLRYFIQMTLLPGLVWHYLFLQALVILLGLFHFFKNKNRRSLYLCVFPVLVHLVLSYFKLYPFDKRLILYLTPFVILLFTSGIYYTVSHFAHKYFSWLIYALLLPVFVVVVRVYTVVPMEKEEIKKSLAYLNEKVSATDHIYVYYSAQPAFQFYKGNYDKVSRNNNIILGKSGRNNWEFYAKEVASLDSVDWLLFSHTYWENKYGTWLNEEEYILVEFEKRGYQVTEKVYYKGSSLYRITPPS